MTTAKRPGCDPHGSEVSEVGGHLVVSSMSEVDSHLKFFVRVDITEEFPFLVTKLSPYYDR